MSLDKIFQNNICNSVMNIENNGIFKKNNYIRGYALVQQVGCLP